MKLTFTERGWEDYLVMMNVHPFKIDADFTQFSIDNK